MGRALSLQTFKAWMAETILSGSCRAHCWWYDDHPPGIKINQHGAIGTLKEEKIITLVLLKCTPTPIKQTITMVMSMKDLQSGLIMPNRVALLREGVNEEVWHGEPLWLSKPKEKAIHLFFTIEGDYE